MDIVNSLVLLANFVLFPAITYGSQLALGALGVTLTFGILRYANFAHGDLMAIGTITTIFVTWGLNSMGVSLGIFPTALIALPIGIVAAVVVAMWTDRLVYRRFREKKAAGITLTMASVGVMFVYGGFVRMLIGTEDQRFADGSRFLLNPRLFKEWSGLEEGLSLRMTSAITVVVAIVVMVALFYFLNRTLIGKVMRAYSDNDDLAFLSGINPAKVVTTTLLLSASLATVAGVLYGLDKSFKPFTYFQLLLPIFAAVIVGGIGQPIGAVIGSYIVAFSEVSLTYAYRKVLTYHGFEPAGLVQLIGTEYKFAISFVILVMVLLIRPTGIMKGRVL